MSPALAHRWSLGLTLVLALLYAWIALAGQRTERWLGLLGAALILAAVLAATAGSSGRPRPAGPPRRRAVAALLLAAGALPLAVADWWSLVTPLLGVLTLAVGIPAVLSAPERIRQHPTAGPAGATKPTEPAGAAGSAGAPGPAGRQQIRPAADQAGHRDQE